METSPSDNKKLEKLQAITKPFAGLLYDIDGTLADNMPAHIAAYAEACRRHNIKLDPALIEETAGWPTVKIAEEISIRYQTPLDYQEFADLKAKIFIEDFVKETKPINFVYNHLLENMGNKRIALVSGGRRSTLRHTLKAIDMEGKYEVLVSADDTEKGKPYADPFLRAAELLDIDPSQCIVMEDGNPGVQGAIAAGMQWVRVDQL